ncbi:hypothetical protein HWV62_22792 [Athelia sp. TMB]|nr:hypothetical protein HWV62_22792 [Athelia sp. TMB]
MNVTHSPYSWHQSHDQATLLLVVPYETQEEDIVVVFGKNHLLAARERTTSTISTTSTQSSYAFISDPEMASSFAASLDSGQVSDAEDYALGHSSSLTSPLSTPSDERSNAPLTQRRTHTTASSRAVSPGHPSRSMASSFSSVDSVHAPHSGRLLTLHLEKEQSIIWPSLIVGPVEPSQSPCALYPFEYDPASEQKYNMDPTSLVLVGLELFDIRKDKDGAFEYFATSEIAHESPVSSGAISEGTTVHHLQRICGNTGLAQLYLEAGMLHLEGAAKTLLSSSYSTLSSIRLSDSHAGARLGGPGGSDAWKQDREAASRYFERAQILHPGLEVPALPLASPREHDLEMPSMKIHPSAPASSVYSGDSIPDTGLRKRHKKDELASTLDARMRAQNSLDDSWYLYVPSLLGAGTALLVVGVVGLSFSTWRRNQS